MYGIWWKELCVQLSLLRALSALVITLVWVSLACYASAAFAQPRPGCKVQARWPELSLPHGLASEFSPATFLPAKEFPLTPRDRFGRMKVIAWPLYLALRFLFTRATGNWGTAIILLTTLFNLVMIWPRLLAMKSSAKMAGLQPKVAAIRKRYEKGDRSAETQSEINQEIIALYKSEGVRTYDGCLPILLQVPLLLGLFSVFQNAVELTGARWMWLADLSKPDPSHILPAIILTSMTLTQLITPSPGLNAAQRRAMAILTALIFGIGMSRYASGLALYWATGNVLNLAVQLVLSRSWFRSANSIAASQRDLPRQ